MNNNYNTKSRSEEMILLQLKEHNNTGDSSSSDSEFSDGYDGRLDEEFNAMIKRIKMRKMVEEQQSIKTREKPRETNQLPENSIAVQKQEHIETNQSLGNVSVEVSSVINGAENVQNVTKDHQISMSNQWFILARVTDSIEEEEQDSTFFIDPVSSILHSTTRDSMVPDSELDDSNWTDCESDLTCTENN